MSDDLKRTRLEIHRDAYREGGGRVILLRFEELDAKEARMVNRDIFSSIRQREDEDPYVIYSQVLSCWGVMCPHPQSKRLYGGKRRYPVPQPVEKYLWFNCECCGSVSLNCHPRSKKDATKRKKI